MIAIFICDANSVIGLGHLYRCRTLAYFLRGEGATCVMVGPDVIWKNEEDSKNFLSWEALSNCNVLDVVKVINKYKSYNDPMVAVVDDYRADDNFQNCLRATGVPWLQFEPELKRSIYSDLVLNANPTANINYYLMHGKNSRARYLLGLKYAIIRDDFIKSKPNFNPDKVVGRKRVMIACGAGDDRGVALDILRGLKRNCTVRVEYTVVLGKGVDANGKTLGGVKDFESDDVRLCVDPANLPELVLSSDLAVTAGGGMTYEFAYCGVPMVIFAMTKNQVASKYWQDVGAGVYLGMVDDINWDSLGVVVDELLRSKRALRKMSLMGRQSIDGLGCHRISDEIFHLVSNYE